MVASLGRYEPRDGQLAMAEAVERARSMRAHVLCEAGTGTGKTLAYLVPAMTQRPQGAWSPRRRRPCKSRSSRNDLPLIAEHLGLDVEVALC
jgi:ATP-dependent DNA helicase DinG